MKDEYICDDRNQLENLRKIRAMSDEEFEEYIKAEKAKERLGLPLDISELERITPVPQLLRIDNMDFDYDVANEIMNVVE